MSRPMFDEMNATASGVRAHYQCYQRWLAGQPADVMQARRAEAEMIFRRVGITFAVYGAQDGESAGVERLIPFDLIPRIISAHEWATMERGLVQRVTALNCFLHDIYHGQDIVRAGVIEAQQIFQNTHFRPEMMGVNVPGNIYAHVSGIDIVRVANAQCEGDYYVLEDHLRVPSGVSYMLENRKMMLRLFPALFSPNRWPPARHSPAPPILHAVGASPAPLASTMRFISGPFAARTAAARLRSCFSVTSQIPALSITRRGDNSTPGLRPTFIFTARKPCLT